LVSEEEGVKTIKLEGVAKLTGLEDVIRVVDCTKERAVPLSAGVYVPADCENEYKGWRIPSDVAMRRVMGFSNAYAYYFGGFSNFKMLDNALKEFAGRSISEFGTILDWGCGCGRVTQHLLRRTSAKVYGADIDAENVAWCSENLTAGRFEVSPLMPPTSLASESVDLIVGISVFTHLDEITQNAWLHEVRRLLKPNGIALLTILSEHSFCELPDLGRWTIPPSLFREFRIRGISDSTIGNTLNDVVGLNNFSYYRETWHSHEYVKTRWGSVMRVLGIKRAAHFNYQDLVVLKRDPQWEKFQPVMSWCNEDGQSS
jgi:SAM-dependent methyltransferase